MKGIQVIPAIFYISIAVIILFVIGSLVLTFPGIEERILNLLREWLSLPISDIAVIYHFDEQSGSCVEDASNHGILGRLNNAGDCSSESDMWCLDKIVGSGAVMFKDNQFIVAKPSTDSGKKLLNMENMNGIAIDVWLKIKGAHDSIPIVFKGNSKHDCENGNANYCLILTGDDKIMFKINIKGEKASGYCSITSKSKLSSGFNHVAVRYDNKTNQTRIYIQGMFDNQVECHPGKIAPSIPYDAPLYIGCKDSICPSAIDPQGNKVGGLIMDEFRIYTRAISPEEIVLHFQGIY